MQNKGSAVDSAPFIFFMIPVGPRLGVAEHISLIGPISPIKPILMNLRPINGNSCEKPQRPRQGEALQRGHPFATL